MKLLADQHRSDKSFSVGDWVYFKLQPYRQLSLRVKGYNKFSPRFFGPFQIVQHIGEVAYKLALPEDCPIHPVFHISCLRQKGYNKFSLRFFGPFQIVQRIGEVAYKLALPEDYPIHPVFHISCLR